MIQPSAIVSPNAYLGNIVKIGPFSIGHDNAILHDGERVKGYCEIGVPTDLGDGSPLTLGEECLVRSHSIFYTSSMICKQLSTGHHVMVREMTLIGEGCQLGIFSELQGDCNLGNYTKLQSGVFIGKASRS